MPKQDPSFIQRLWKERPEVNDWAVHRWIGLMYLPDHAFRIAFKFRDWLPSDRTTPPPDLVHYISLYGYMRLRLTNWRLPFELSPEEQERWREAKYYVTLSDFQFALSQVVGGFLKLAGQDPQVVAGILKEQVVAKLTELEQLADLPIEEYTPKYMEWQIRASLKDAPDLKGDALERAVTDAMQEEDHDNEMDRFEQPFTLRQELDSFAWGLEKFRLFSTSEQNEELGLPNVELFSALMQVDLNALLARLHNVDAKLRAIWRNLAKYKCYDLNEPDEPEKFWWRHWKHQPSKPRK